MPRRDDVTLQGMSFLGAAITGDALGAGAAFLTVVRDAVQGSDAQAWRRDLRGLARRGWQAAAEQRSRDGDRLYPLPDRDQCVEYVMECIDSATVPTVDGLMARPGTGLDDRLEPEGCRRAAGLFLGTMLHALLDDRTFDVQQKLARALRDSGATRQRLTSALAQHAERVESLRTRLEAVQTAVQLLGSPGLRPQDRETRGDGLLDYLTEAVAFCGRETELDALVTFCETSTSSGWRWQAITGPGGSGKSRLAWELCGRMRRRGWDAYFLDPAAFEELPPQALSISSADLLLVVDYVAFSTERLGRWLGALPATPRGRLRVIFVERDGWTAPTIDPAVAAPDWFGRLSDAWDAQDLARHFGAVQGLAPVVTLADRSMDATVLTQIVEGVDIARVRRYEADAYPLAPPRPALEGPVPSSVATTIVERLQTVIDPSAQRPLYLLFLVQAYLNDPADDRWRTWDVRDLYGVIYNRERRRVLETVPHGFADVALDVWAFATATRTRLSDALQDAPSWLVATVTDQPNIVQESFRRALRACCGSSDCDAVPYVPDIPGEHLVTRQLSGWRDLDRVRQFAVAAWERSAEGYSAFCSRAVVDLAATRSDPHSVLNPEGLLVEPRKKNDVQALAHALSTAVDPDHPRPDITDWLVTLATRHQDDAEMTRLAIRAVVASASNPAEMGMNSDGNPDFVATLRLAMPPIDKYECRLLQRVLESWAGNVLTLRMKNEELDEFGEIINHRDNLSTLGRSLSQAEIRAQQWVAEHRPNYADVVSECVIALTTASLAVGSAMPWLTVSTVCDHLEAEGISWSPLLSDRSTRPLLRAFALLSATYETLDVTQRRTLADQLRALAYQHSADSDVAIQIAEGFFNLTIKAELEENRNLVNELRQLTTRNPDTPEIARQLAMGLVNLTWKRETDLEETRSLVDELRQLTSPHLDNLQMASQLAMGLVNLTIKAELEETRSLVNELRQLTTRHPDTPEIAVRLSKGLFNLTIETMNDTEETRTLLQELDHLWTQLRVDDHLVTVIDSLEEFMDDRGGVALEGANSVARDVLEQGAITTKVLTELSRRWVKKYGSVPEDPR